MQTLQKNNFTKDNNLFNHLEHSQIADSEECMTQKNRERRIQPTKAQDFASIMTDSFQKAPFQQGTLQVLEVTIHEEPITQRERPRSRQDQFQIVM